MAMAKKKVKSKETEETPKLIFAIRETGFNALPVYKPNDEK